MFLTFLIATFKFSCAFIDKSLEWDEQANSNYKIISSSNELLYCDKKSNHDITFFSSSQIAQETFQSLFKKNDFRNFNDFEFFISFILIHLSVRPDLVTASSRLQYFNIHNDQYTYHDWLEQDDSPNLIMALNKILQQKSNRALINIARTLDRNMPASIPVELGLQQFLHRNRKKIEDNPTLSQYFIKGNQTIRVGETFPPLPLATLISDLQRNYNLETDLSPLDHLFGPFQKVTGNTDKLFCNFDLELYTRNIHLVLDRKSQENLDLGYYNKRSNTLYLSTIATNTANHKIDQDRISVMSQAQTGQAAFCYFENPVSRDRILLSSTKDRDPGQYIMQLIENNIFAVSTISELKDIQNLPRSQTLYNPKRILFENNRAKPNDLQKLFSKDIPIYYANRLGAVNSFYHSSSKDTSSFLLDSRRDIYLSCQN